MDLVLTCWSEMQTERQVGMGVGAVPISAVRRWAREVAVIDDDAEQLLVEVIRDLDAEFLAGVAAKQKG